ncbi:MAG: hypothetical protein OXD54_18120 [Candidatus Poribacteria bacterium]|nr:hypothetical protein [Candidatus Poribacteria bacterium]
MILSFLEIEPASVEQTDADYSGVISLELFNPSYWEEDPEEAAKIGLEKMRAIVGL